MENLASETNKIYLIWPKDIQARRLLFITFLSKVNWIKYKNEVD